MAKTKNKIKINFALPVTFLREGPAFVAYSPAIDMSTSANSFELAKKRFVELVHIFFEELVESNTLDEVLLELGWQKVNSNWQPPVVVATETEPVEVEIPA